MICDEGSDCDCDLRDYDCDLPSTICNLRGGASYVDDDGRATATGERVLGFWFGFAVLVQRLCIGVFFLFFYFLLINTVYCFWFVLLLLCKL